MTSSLTSKLIEFLNVEKTRSQERMRQTSLFLKECKASGASLTTRESIEILRQNAEADYDCMLHLLAILNKSQSSSLNRVEEGDRRGKTNIVPSKNGNKPLLEVTTDNEFDTFDPLDEGEEERLSEDDDDDDDDDDEYEERERPLPVKIEDLARSLPVSVPWPKKSREPPLPAILDRDDIPTDIHREIAMIARSLQANPFDFGELPKPRFNYQAE